MTTAHSRLSGILLALAVTGCSGAGTPEPKAIPDSPTIASPMRSANTSEPRSAFQSLYVANRGDESCIKSFNVSAYAPGLDTIRRKIPVHLGGAKILAMDRHGELYSGSWCRRIISSDEATVKEYLPGATVAERTLYEGKGFPSAFAFDANNNLYVALWFTFSDDINVYAAGTGHLLRTISNGIYNPRAMVFDQSGNLYVATHSLLAADKISVYKPGALDPFRSIIDGVYAPQALAFDAHGNLYVANWRFGFPDTVTVYAPGGATVSRTIREGIREPASLLFDGAGNLYVANSGSVTVYAAGTGSLIRTLGSGKITEGIAFGPSGDLYVLRNRAVDVYASGRDTPIRTITNAGANLSALLFGP